jgi:hypothetical protein
LSIITAKSIMKLSGSPSLVTNKEKTIGCFSQHPENAQDIAAAKENQPKGDRNEDAPKQDGEGKTTRSKPVGDINSSSSGE